MARARLLGERLERIYANHVVFWHRFPPCSYQAALPLLLPCSYKNRSRATFLQRARKATSLADTTSSLRRTRVSRPRRARGLCMPVLRATRFSLQGQARSIPSEGPVDRVKYLLILL